MGGGGLVAARHLDILGVKVEIIGASKKRNVNVSRELKILRKMGVREVKKISKCGVIIDALLGYNIKGKPGGRYGEFIEEVNKTNAKVVSLDLPSGVDPDSGRCYEPCIKADYTLTLALPKVGLRKNKKVGKLYLVNIGIPRNVYSDLGIEVGNYFKDGDVVGV